MKENSNNSKIQPLILGMPPDFIYSHNNDLQEYSIRHEHLILLQYTDSEKKKIQFIVQSLDDRKRVTCLRCQYQNFLEYDLSPNCQFFVYFGGTKDFNNFIVITHLSHGTDRIVKYQNQMFKIKILKAYFDCFLILQLNYQTLIYNYQGEILQVFNTGKYIMGTSLYSSEQIKSHISDCFHYINSKNPTFLKQTFIGNIKNLKTDIHLKNSNISVLSEMNFLDWEVGEKIIYLQQNNKSKILRKLEYSGWLNCEQLEQYERTTINFCNYLTTYFLGQIYLIDYTTGVAKIFQEMKNNHLRVFEGEYYAIQDKDSIHIWTKKQLIKSKYTNH